MMWTKDQLLRFSYMVINLPVPVVDHGLLGNVFSHVAR